MHEVSLYIPCFNAAKTIESCLDAAAKQSYPIKEILVVDDGSTDETISRLSRYPFKLIRHNTNLGLAVARNAAIKSLKAEFIASLDADCLPEYDWLENLMKRLDSSKIAGAGGKLLESYSSSVFDMWRSIHMKQFWSDEKVSPPFLFGSNTVFRKEALMKVGLYDERFKENYEDVEICNDLKKARYSVIYEPKALVHHLKVDDISSLLNTYWKWHLAFYLKEGYYSDAKSLRFKIKDNLGLSRSYIEEDIASDKYQVIYLDFLLALHHSLRDFEYYISLNNPDKCNLRYSNTSLCMTLLDLTFFYHFNPKEKKISTLIPKKNSFLQNFIALNLLLGDFIKNNFKSSDFQKRLHRHLLFSVFNLDNPYLLDGLLNLIELHPEWEGLINKKHPSLNSVFLRSFFLEFQDWLEKVIIQFPKIIQIIEISAEMTDRFCFAEGGQRNEDK